MTEDELVGCLRQLKDMGLSKLWEILKDREAWHATVHGAAELDMTEQLNNKAYLPLMNLIEMFFLCK